MDPSTTLRTGLTRRDFLVLAAAMPLAAHLPALSRQEEPARPLPAVELPIAGLAGECSGRY